MRSKFWSSILLVFVAMLMIASTWTFSGVSVAMKVSDIVSALLIIVIAIVRLRREDHKADYLLFFVGLWLQFAPLAFWAELGGSYLNDTLTGFVVMFVAMLWHEEAPHPLHATPKGWSYNPSRLSERVPIAALSLLCWLTARTMASYQLGYLHELIDPVFGNGTIDVITSPLSKKFPVSDAGLGAMAYTLETIMALHGGEERWHKKPIFVLFFCMLIIPVGLVSTILIILQPLIVGAWCFWCLLTAIMMLFMITFAVDEMVLTYQFLKMYRKKAPSLYTLLVKGSSCLKEPLHITQEPSPIFPMRGIGFPPTLIVAALVGLVLMFYSSRLQLSYLIASLDHILGALVVLISVISFAEPARNLRWLLIPIAAVVFIYSWTLTSFPLLFHLSISIALALLAIRKGHIKESFQLQ